MLLGVNVEVTGGVWVAGSQLVWVEGRLNVCRRQFGQTETEVSGAVIWLTMLRLY